MYWRHDILQALLILSRAVRLGDPRTREALDMVEKKRRPDGLWRAEACYWSLRRTQLKSAKMNNSNMEVVDWGRRGPNRMISLNALRVLKNGGRLKQ